jgi:uncharacterized protein (TIGR02145 family)
MTSLKVLVRVVIILLFNGIYIELQGQSPNKMGFQAVIKDDSGDLVSNDSVGLRMSILQGSESGTVVYSETHGEMTNEIGLITVEIGGGTVVSGVFADIDWANGPYFFKREIDPAGGTNYVISVTSQFLSIPYAMYANVADTALNVPPSFDGDYNSLTNKPTLPTKTSDLVNDSGFFTSEVDSSITNEIQTISKVDRTVTLSNSGGSFVDSVLTEAQVDAYVNNNGYLTSEIDSSITNEIQTISKVDRTVTLSNNGGSFVDSILTEAQVDAYIINNGYLTSEIDSSITNEIQTISKVDRTVTLSNNGGSFVDSILTEAQVDTYVSNNGYLFSEVDSSSTNELQNLRVSLTGDTLFLSNNDYVIFPGISLANLPRPTPSHTDCTGYVYDTIHIDDQVWFAENLKTPCYFDGELIPNVADDTSWAALSTGARTYYDNDSTQYDTVYGALYNWYAVETGKLCPAGWHVPTDEDWRGLLYNVNPWQGIKYETKQRLGDVLKEVGFDHWNPTDSLSINWSSYTITQSSATDGVGFTALPGGLRTVTGSFRGIKSSGYWWSSTPINSDDSYWYRFIYDKSSTFYRGSNYGKVGVSVRCIKDG